jgi:hypothetical protein
VTCGFFSIDIEKISHNLPKEQALTTPALPARFWNPRLLIAADSNTVLKNSVRGLLKDLMGTTRELKGETSKLKAEFRFQLS